MPTVPTWTGRTQPYNEDSLYSTTILPSNPRYYPYSSAILPGDKGYFIYADSWNTPNWTSRT